jgi:spermidine synthase
MLDRTTSPDGAELILYERDGVFTIRVDGLELMSSRAHGSEEELARLVLTATKALRPRVLVGGLGMGYTLRAVLEARPRVSEIVVAEVFPAVVEWNRNQLSTLAGDPLGDSRVSLFEGDVADLLASSRAGFDAILLDVDNGPEAFTLQRNAQLYSNRGLSKIHCALRTRGVLGVWSADPDDRFARRLERARFDVHVETVRARISAKGPKHTIFVAHRR